MRWLLAVLTVSAVSLPALAADDPASYTLQFDANLRPSPLDQMTLSKGDVTEGDVLEVIYNPTRVFSNVQQEAGLLAFAADNAPPELTSLFIVSASSDVRFVSGGAATPCASGAITPAVPGAVACDQLTDRAFSFVTTKANLGVYECKLGGNATLKDVAPQAWLFTASKRVPPGPAFKVSGIQGPNLTVSIDGALTGVAYKCTVGVTPAAVTPGGASPVFTAPTPAAAPFPVSCSIMGGTAAAPTAEVISTTALTIADKAQTQLSAPASPAINGTQCLRYLSSVKPLPDLDSPVRVGTFLGAGPDVPLELTKRADGTYGVLVPLKAGANTYRMEVSRGGKGLPAGPTTTFPVYTKDTHSLVRVQAELIAGDRLRKLDFAFAVAPVSRSFFRPDGGPWSSKCFFLCTVAPMIVVRLASGTSNADSVLSLGGGIAIFINRAFQLNGGLLVGTNDLQTSWRADRNWFVGVALDPFIISETIQPQPLQPPKP